MTTPPAGASTSKASPKQTQVAYFLNFKVEDFSTRPKYKELLREALCEMMIEGYFSEDPFFFSLFKRAVRGEEEEKEIMKMILNL